MSRLPFLLPLARTLHMRLKHQQAHASDNAPLPAEAVAAPGEPADLSQLPDAARRVFDDLRRSAHHS